MAIIGEDCGCQRLQRAPAVVRLQGGDMVLSNIDNGDEGKMENVDVKRVMRFTKKKEREIPLFTCYSFFLGISTGRERMMICGSSCVERGNMICNGHKSGERYYSAFLHEGPALLVKIVRESIHLIGSTCGE